MCVSRFVELGWDTRRMGPTFFLLFSLPFSIHYTTLHYIQIPIANPLTFSFSLSLSLIFDYLYTPSKEELRKQ